MLESVKVALRRSVSVNLAELWRVIAWKGAGGRREVEYLILLDEIVGLGGGFSD
jgi:hypothetical protein